MWCVSWRTSFVRTSARRRLCVCLPGHQSNAHARAHELGKRGNLDDLFGAPNTSTVRNPHTPQKNSHILQNLRRSPLSARAPPSWEHNVSHGKVQRGEKGRFRPLDEFVGDLRRTRTQSLRTSIQVLSCQSGSIHGRRSTKISCSPSDVRWTTPGPESKSTTPRNIPATIASFLWEMKTPDGSSRSRPPTW